MFQSGPLKFDLFRVLWPRSGMRTTPSTRRKGSRLTSVRKGLIRCFFDQTQPPRFLNLNHRLGGEEQAGWCSDSSSSSTRGTMSLCWGCSDGDDDEDDAEGDHMQMDGWGLGVLTPTQGSWPHSTLQTSVAVAHSPTSPSDQSALSKNVWPATPEATPPLIHTPSSACMAAVLVCIWPDRATMEGCGWSMAAAALCLCHRRRESRASRRNFLSDKLVLALNSSSDSSSGG